MFAVENIFVPLVKLVKATKNKRLSFPEFRVDPVGGWVLQQVVDVLDRELGKWDERLPMINKVPYCWHAGAQLNRKKNKCIN